MTKDMPVHELCKFVSDRSDDYRVYNWREVEAMRERLSNVEMQHSSCEARVIRLSALLHKVKGMMAEMRDAGAYEWADKLRDALEGKA
jgi:hypothetical protein